MTRHRKISGVWLILTTFIMVLSLSCGGDGDGGGGGPAPAVDTDGDGLTDQLERTLFGTYGTSPVLADTDGDGRTDFDEYVDFNPANPYNSNPLIADVPRISIEIISTPKVTINFARSGGITESVNNQSSTEIARQVSHIDTSTSSESVERNWSAEIGAELEISATPSFKISGKYGWGQVTTGETGVSWTDQQTEENRTALSRSETFEATAGWSAENATVEVTVNVMNSGNRTFTLKSIDLSAAMPDVANPRGYYDPIGNLAIPGFSETSIAPGDVKGPWTFEKTIQSIDYAKQILASYKGLIIKVAGYQLVDVAGTPFEFLYDTVLNRTATMTIDYCGKRQQEKYMVTTRSDPDDPTVSMTRIMTDYLGIPYEVTNGGLTGIRDIKADAAKNGSWIAVRIYYDANTASMKIATFDMGAAAYDFENIRLGTGDVLQLVYREDKDGDGLYSREEFMNGSSDVPVTGIDSDKDGLTDVEELPLGTGPGLFDSDFDGLNDTADARPREKDRYLIDAGEVFSLAIRTGGDLLVWGRNNHGQLGDGTTYDEITPKLIDTGILIWYGVSGGGEHTLGIVADQYSNPSSLYAWGRNDLGQLGSSAPADRSSPGNAVGTNAWKQVAAGYAHSLGIRFDGTLYAWGYNNYGQLGIGILTTQTTPTLVSYDTQWKQVSAGSYHSAAVKYDGSLYTWGYNAYGQLGNGNTTDLSVPTAMAGTAQWVQVSTGGNHTAAIRDDGSLWTWGDNSHGQLGNGYTSNMSDPVQIGTDSWKQVAAGYYHTLAIKADGSLWAWGYNGSGALGTPTTTTCLVNSVDKPCSKVPIRIGTNTDWVVVSAGAEHSLAVRSDGNIYAWGWNIYGQVGNNDAPNSAPSPVLVESIQSGDIWPPRVVATSPANDAVGVLANAVISATFNESMNCATVNASTFTLALRDAPYTAVNGTVTCAGTTATFAPSEYLAWSTAYTATITTGVEDLAGYALTAEKTWSFTTLPPPAAPTEAYTTVFYFFPFDWPMVYWKDNSDNEMYFEIWRSNTLCSAATDATWTLFWAITSPGSGTGWVGPVPDQTQSHYGYVSLCYKVRARNLAGTSDWSNTTQYGH